MDELHHIRESSNYLATLLRRPELVDWLSVQKNLYRRYALTALYEDLERTVRSVRSFDELLISFREFKQRHFLRIGGRDLLGLADLPETTSQLSDLACVALQVGLDLLNRRADWWLSEDEKDSWRHVRESHQLVVMGLGKLGGHELNYVSDVDLLFLRASQEKAGCRSPESLVILNRLCQWLTRLLADNIHGDRVFLVDLRLRPQGKDGTLVPTVEAAAEHYLHAGRPWERQMLLKARPVAGARSAGMAFVQEVRPFVFRRFLDFQALDELRAMRDRILAESVRPRPGWQQFDVKLGVGGIREIEFLVQSLQLIYGGRHPELDEPNTLQCLDHLSSLHLLTPEAMAELKNAYVFLRRVEHWVQLDQNRQTQKLPRSEESLERLAHALGFERDEKKLLARLEECCSIVHGHFLALFHSDDDKGLKGREPSDARGYDRLEAFDPSSVELLSRLESHLDLFPGAVRGTIAEILAPYLVAESQEVREKVILRLERYFGQVRKRPGLVKVFLASEPWLGDFCRGLVKSEFLADLLAHHPSLVEGLSTRSGIHQDFATWEAAGNRLLERSENYEEGLEWIRRLKNERLLQLVLGDLSGSSPHEALERDLTDLADYVIGKTHERVRKSLGLEQDLPLSILGLGKLGSREMSYHSDLDLVFVYDPGKGDEDGRIPGDVIRLTQRFMRMLSTPLQEGPGYAVDARLRPSGNYGPLIVTRKAWLEYYTEQADLWEIQALLRVRHVAGNPELGLWIENKAQEICYRKRDPSEVWGRLCHLRKRMQQERAEEKGDMIDIKLGVGGLVDLEFFVQGHLLTEGYGDPSIRSSSVRSGLKKLLRTIQDLDAPAHIESAFEVLRSLEHRLRLHTNQPVSRLTPKQFASLQAIGLWPSRQGGRSVESWHDLQRLRRRVRKVLNRWCPDL